MFFSKYLLFIQIIATVFAMFMSFFIFLGGTRTPYGDQAQVYNAAMCFNSGDYIYLSPGGYLDMYPQQLGYVLCLQLLFKLTGVEDFRLIQIINILFAGGIVFLTGRLIDDLTNSILPKVFGTVILTLSLPLYLFTTLTYGDIPALFFSMLFLHCFIVLFKKHEKNLSYTFVCLASLCIAVLLKKNAVILMIAAAIVTIIHAFTERSKKIIVFLICLIFLPLLTLSSINKYYSAVSGYDVSGGLPALSWIAMGTIEEGCPGWFNNYPVPVYHENNFDKEATSKAAAAKLRERISYFFEDPVYGISFWKRKVCTQWNDPFYHADGLIEVDENEIAKGLTNFLAEHRDGLRTMLSVLQNIIYLGVFLNIISRTHDKNFYKALPEICILGGFLFSLIWEANSRFIITYYLISLPLACNGLNQFYNSSISKIFCDSDASIV